MGTEDSRALIRPIQIVTAEFAKQLSEETLQKRFRLPKTDQSLMEKTDDVFWQKVYDNPDQTWERLGKSMESIRQDWESAKMAAHQAVREWRALEARMEEYDDNPIEPRDRADGMAKRVARQKNVIAGCAARFMRVCCTYKERTRSSRQDMRLDDYAKEIIYGSRAERVRLEMVLKDIDGAIDRAKNKQNKLMSKVLNKKKELRALLEDQKACC
ncbi:unnamed protein product [Nippostrongylus brasiliensis]|uniref:Uncharacterized protein n=1 Tax=Nippostrongylus brasiliensis TaxID=27835 RepID=A0A0N4XWD7_NIPBR|nr:unnamed protein product [Nippostrongylus brasiliensis]